MPYVIAHSQQHGLLVLAEARVKPMEEITGPLRVVAQMTGTSIGRMQLNSAGQDLVGTRYTHTFHPMSAPSPRPVVFASSHVTSESGTGLVHSAPAHGHEDYTAFQKAGLLPQKLRCPIDDAGCFTPEVAEWADTGSAKALIGKNVLDDAVLAVIDLLREQNALLAEQTIEHRYPHDWKSKEPVIVRYVSQLQAASFFGLSGRATPQWFADVEAIKPRALKALEAVKFYPPQCVSHRCCFTTSRAQLIDFTSTEPSGSLRHLPIRMVYLEAEKLGCSHSSFVRPVWTTYTG